MVRSPHDAFVSGLVCQPTGIPGQHGARIQLSARQTVCLYVLSRHNAHDPSLIRQLRSWQQFSVLSELPKLKHLRIRSLSNALIFEILKALPNLESLYTEYVMTDQNIEPKPFAASLRHLTIATSIPNRSLAEPLWTWILQLTPRRSLETLQIQTVSMIDVPKEFIQRLAYIHGPILEKFSVGYLAMSASDIADLCTSCPCLEFITCTTNSPAVRSFNCLVCNRLIADDRLAWGQPYLVHATSDICSLA